MAYEFHNDLAEKLKVSYEKNGVAICISAYNIYHTIQISQNMATSTYVIYYNYY